MRRSVWRLALLGMLLGLAACREVVTGPAVEAPQSVLATPEAVVAAPPTATTAVPELPDLGPAPELANDVWINSEPLTLAGLQGKVVLIEFWTFG